VDPRCHAAPERPPLHQPVFALLTVLLYDMLSLKLTQPSVASSIWIKMALLSMGLPGTLVAQQMEGQAREGFLQRRTIRDPSPTSRASRGSPCRWIGRA
jgi:hypothetical protein